MFRSALCRLPAIAALLVPAFSAPALAAGLPNNMTIDAKVNERVSQTTETYYRNGKRDVSRTKYGTSQVFRLFKLKGVLVVSMPDFQKGTIFTGETARTKNAYRATKGKFSCKDTIMEGGGRYKLCLKYSENGNVLKLTLRETGNTEDGKLSRTQEIDFALTPGDCTARSHPYKVIWNNDEAIMQPQTVSRVMTQENHTFNGSSCRLIKGRKAF